MGKKKIVKNSIKILRTGKIKLEKGQKVDLTSFVQKSIDDVTISRLDGIISKGDVVIEDAKVHTEISLNDEFKIADLSFRTGSQTVKTIIVTINKKNYAEEFNFLNSDIVGKLLRTSTLAPIYNCVKKKWFELNKDDNTQFTNVLAIPNIMVFSDPETGKIKKNPFYVNLIVLAVPSQSKMNENKAETISTENAIARVIADMCDAAIKIGAKDLVIDPFGYKLLRKNPAEASKLWNEIATTQKFIEQFDSCIFAIPDENFFIVFNSNK